MSISADVPSQNNKDSDSHERSLRPLNYISSDAAANKWGITRVAIGSTCDGDVCKHSAKVHLDSGEIVHAPAKKAAEVKALLRVLGLTLSDSGTQHFASTPGEFPDQRMIYRLDISFPMLRKRRAPLKTKRKTLEDLMSTLTLRKRVKSTRKEKEPRASSARMRART